MTNTQPTPGPWTVRPFHNDQGGIPIDPPKGYTVALVYDEHEANARLIATACNACLQVNPSNPIAVAEATPELVKALRLVAEVYESNEWGGPTYIPPFVATVRAVLAKLEDTQ